eukprot:61889_1
MKLIRYILAIALGLPIVGAGDSLRGSQEKDATDQDQRALSEFKETAAQQRQRQRDDRRFRTDPYRTQRQEDKERARKRTQAIRRDNPEGEPYDPYSGELFFPE